MNLKKGQKVIAIAGDDKGKSGKIIKLAKNGDYVWVEGLNIVTKHVKPNPTFQIKGGIVKIEGKIHSSNVRIVEETKKDSEIKDVKIKKVTKVKSTSKSKDEVEK